MKRRAIGLLVLSFALYPTASVAADDGSNLQLTEQQAQDLALQDELSRELDRINSDPKALDDAMYWGELRASLCKACHGEDGNSQREGIPSLAGQNPVYLVDQFQRYGTERRKDFWMGSLAKSIKREDKIRLAIYYSRKTMRPTGGGDQSLQGYGKQLYTDLCVDCHGEDARGPEGYARLAGQRPEYLVKMLEEFRTASGKRFNPWMFSMANQLRSDRDRLAIATYLANLE